MDKEFDPEKTAVLTIDEEKKTTVIATLAKVTGRTVEELKLLQNILPVPFQKDPSAIILYAMKCHELGLSPFGGGLYIANFGGDDEGGGGKQISFVLNYNAMMGLVGEKIEDHFGECVYAGEKFTINIEAGTYEHVQEPEKRHGYPLGAYYWVQVKGSGKRRLVYVAWVDAARKTKTGAIRRMWQENSYDMMRKCALRRALTIAFPKEFTGVYSEGEGLIAPDENGSEKKEPRPIRELADANLLAKMRTAIVKAGRTRQEVFETLGINPNLIHADEAERCIAECEKRPVVELDEKVVEEIREERETREEIRKEYEEPETQGGLFGKKKPF